MTHECNTQGKKDIAITTDLLKSLEDNIISNINSLRDDSNSLKDVVITRLQEDNTQLQAKCDSLERRVDVLQSSIDDLEQYDWRNNLILSGIPDSISDDDLEETVTSILSVIDVQVTINDVETCHRIWQSDENKSKKTIICFVNRKHCRKILENKKKLASSDFSKYKFPVSTKIFANENLTFKNETLASHGRKLKCVGHIFSSCTRSGVVFRKKSERSKSIKRPSLKTYDQFSGVFSEYEENDAERSTHQDSNFN